jgi:hypothetical protein
MRIRQPTERWFKVPGDPDKAEIKIKTLTPKERFDIYDAAFKQELIYEPGDERPQIKQITDKSEDRLRTAVAVVADWKNVFDRDDKPMKCTPKNVVAAVEGIEGFMSFIRECMQKLENDLAAEKRGQEKNLPSA